MDESPANEATIILITSTALLLLLVITLVIIILFQQKRKHQHREQLAQMQNLNEQALLKSKLKIQEDTFLAISQNLHDSVGSNISTAMLLLYKDEHSTPEEIESNQQEVLSILDKVVDDLKNIARSMNAGYLENIGLNEAINNRIGQLCRSRKYKIESTMDVMPQRLNRQKQLILFYIFQEAINNITNHAQAKNIGIYLQYEHDRMMMRIADNGIGMEESGPEELLRKGSGLINMKNHATMINATLDIKSKNPGTEINVIVPDPYL
jgi:two-component system, NarL family, sensor kinase